MKLLLVLALVSSSLLLLVNAEYRWDADAQEWVLVDDETPTEDSSDDTGGSGYDDEDYGYDDEAGSGDDSYDRHGGYNTPNIDNQSSNKNVRKIPITKTLIRQLRDNRLRPLRP